MKMKKTQSLKLMLVGLLCSMGMSSWAAVGDIFTSDMLVLKQTSDTECMVIAVADYGDAPDYTIVIPDKVKNSFDKDKELYVSALDDNWFCGGNIALIRHTPEGEDQVAGSAVAENLLDKNAPSFALKLEATRLTKLNTYQIAMVNSKIKKFIVTATSGLTEIPDHAFHKNTYVVDETATQKAKDEKQKDIDAAQDHLDGLDVAVIKDGKYNGKQVYTKKNKYYVLGDAVDPAEADDCGEQLYQVLQVKADGTTAVVKNKKVRAKSDGSEIGWCTISDGEVTWHNFADKFEGDALYSSLQDKVTAAQNAVAAAQDAVTDAHNATVLAEAAVLDPAYARPEVQEKAEKAQALLDAIAAFDGNSALQSKVATHTNTAFQEVTPWFIAFVLATDEEFLNSLASASTLKPLVKKFVDAYKDFFPGEEPTVETILTINVNPMTAWWVTGDAISENYLNPTGEGLYFFSSNWPYNFKVQLLDEFDYIPGTNMSVPVPDGYLMYRGIQSDYYNDSQSDPMQTFPQEWIESNSNSLFFIKETSGTPVKGKYYTVFRYKALSEFESPDVPEEAIQVRDEDDDLAGYLVPEYGEYGYYNDPSFLLVQIDPETEEFSLQREVPNEIDITAAYPGIPIQAALDAAETTDLEALAEQARQDEAQANKELTAAKKALAQAKKDLKDGQADLKAAQDAKDAVKDVYHFVWGGNTQDAFNETLVYVEWTNEKITRFGDFAFTGCSVAEFKNLALTDGDTQFPASTNYIGHQAFASTQINARLDHTHANIEKIRLMAFIYTKTTTVNLKDATKLNDTSIGTQVWDECPIETIDLENTQLTQMPHNLCEGIKRGDEAKDCDGKPVVYTYEIKEGEMATKTAKINTTLTTVVMPKGSTKIRDINFWFCENLNSITIPAGVNFIGEYALAGTALTGLDLTALKDLAHVGDGAFAYNPVMTSVKFAPTSPFESLEGDIFRCDNSLATIELNDSVKCIEAGLFADTKITKLDLSKTQITVLPDLFKGNEEKGVDANSVCNTLTEILLPERQMDALNDKVLRPGLQVIGNHAFAFLQGITEMTIPSTVWAMGTWAFAYCTNLKKVTAMDSRLTNLGSGTFRNCTNLEDFTFVTLSVIDPEYQVVPKQMGLLPIIDEPIPLDPGAIPVPIDDPETPDVFTDQCGNVVDLGGTFDFDDTQFYLCTKKPVITVTEESYDILKGQYYKAYAQEYSELAIFQPTLTLKKKGLDLDGNDQYSDGYYNVNYGTWIPVTEASVFTAYQDLNKVLLFKAKHNNGYYKIPALNFRGEAFGGDYDDVPYWLTKGAIQQNIWQYNAKDLPITEIAQGSPAVIIISDKSEIKVERHSRPGEKYQSTLDRDNELKIAANPLKTDMTSIICAWGKQEGVVTFWRFNNGMTLPKGQVVLPLSAWQGTANGRIEVVFVDDEVTSIKDYIKALNDSSDTIYNLQGIRVKNTVKGQLYIKNGQKFIQQ